METVTNIASAASKAIWGEGTTATNETAGAEPVSGETGNVDAGEPYDKGNAGLSTTAEPKSLSSTDTTAPTSSDPAATLSTSTFTKEERSADTPLAEAAGDKPIAAAVDPSGPTSTSTTEKAKENSGTLEGAETAGSSNAGDVGLPAPSSEGTANKEVKSTGMTVGGGDFAEREADRLSKEQGIAAPAKTETKPEVKEKKSLKEKIKAKLHKH